MKIIDLLKLPSTRKIEALDAPYATLVHAEIIQAKFFLKKLYADFYKQFKEAMPDDAATKKLVELGSGGGFIKDIIPNVVTSDIMELPNVDICFSGLEMPFEDNKIDAFFMIDVLHHVHDSLKFIRELNRCLKNGGKVIMIEPANTLWSRFIYENFHHEPFDPYGHWGVEPSGPLSSANGAIPWIIFYRDILQFKAEFPHLMVRRLKTHTPFRYLVSGGLSMYQLLPSFTYNIVRGVENLLSPLNKYFGMFLTVELEKRDS